MRGVWQLRPAANADLEGMLAITRAEGAALGQPVDVDVNGVRESLAANPRFAWGRDAMVARVGDWSEARQRERGEPRLRVGAPGAAAEVLARLADAGYRLERFYATMVRDLARGGSPQPPRLPAGYRLRPMDPTQRLRRTRRSPRGLVVQAPDGSAAGSLIGERPPARPVGHCLVLAVDPAHQRRGLGRALLSAAFTAIHAAGLASAELQVASDNPRALELYESVGMVAHRRYEIWWRQP